MLGRVSVFRPHRETGVSPGRDAEEGLFGRCRGMEGDRGSCLLRFGLSLFRLNKMVSA